MDDKGKTKKKKKKKKKRRRRRKRHFENKEGIGSIINSVIPIVLRRQKLFRPKTQARRGRREKVRKTPVEYYVEG